MSFIDRLNIFKRVAELERRYEAYEKYLNGWCKRMTQKYPFEEEQYDEC